MACKQERMHMQIQRQYLNRQNGGVPNLAHLLLLFIIILVIPISCISCQQNKRVVPISKHNDSIHAKIPNDTSLIHSDTSLEGKIFHIDNTVTIDSITHLPDTNKIFVFRDGKKIQTIIYKYNWEEYGSPTIGRDSIGKIDFVDVDFDGNKDLLIYKGGFGNQGADIYDCFLWNDNKHQFKIAPSFSYILNPSIDNRQKCIYSFSRENASSYVNVKYKFQNGEFRAISTLKEKVDNGKMVYILETSQNGVLHKKNIAACRFGRMEGKNIDKVRVLPLIRIVIIMLFTNM